MIDDKACGVKTFNGAYSCTVPITEQHRIHKATDANGKPIIAWSDQQSDE